MLVWMPFLSAIASFEAETLRVKKRTPSGMVSYLVQLAMIHELEECMEESFS